MPFLTRSPIDFKDPPNMPASGRHLMPGAVGIFFRLPETARLGLHHAQHRDPYGRSGLNGMQMLSRLVAAHRTDRQLSRVEGANIEMMIAAIEHD